MYIQVYQRHIMLYCTRQLWTERSLDASGNGIINVHIPARVQQPQQSTLCWRDACIQILDIQELVQHTISYYIHVSTYHIILNEMYTLVRWHASSIDVRTSKCSTKVDFQQKFIFQVFPNPLTIIKYFPNFFWSLFLNIIL